MNGWDQFDPMVHNESLEISTLIYTLHENISNYLQGSRIFYTPTIHNVLECSIYLYEILEYSTYLLNVLEYSRHFWNWAEKSR